MDEQPKTNEQDQSLLQQTLAAVEALNKANAEKKALLDREERLLSERILSGHADAGSQGKSHEEQKKEKEVEDARRLLAGTGYEDILFPLK